MSKILFVDAILPNDNPMSTCYIQKCDMIKRDPRFHYYDINSNEQVDINMYETVIFGCRSVYLYKCHRGSARRTILEKNNHLCHIKNKYLIIQDMHPKTYLNMRELCQFLVNNNINIIFTFYHNTEARTIRSMTTNLKHLHLPHHVNTSIFKFMDLEKKYDILLFGSIHPKHYPFRKRLFELILKNKDKFEVRHIPLPGKFDPQCCENGLAELINVSKICIATKSRYDYLVGKYFEIGMCKTLIAGDIPTDGITIFKNKILELGENMNDEEIINRLSEAINNYPSYSSKIEELKTHICQDFSLDKYVDKLHHMIVSAN